MKSTGIIRDDVFRDFSIIGRRPDLNPPKFSPRIGAPKNNRKKQAIIFCDLDRERVAHESAPMRAHRHHGVLFAQIRSSAPQFQATPRRLRPHPRGGRLRSATTAPTLRGHDRLSRLCPCALSPKPRRIRALRSTRSAPLGLSGPVACDPPRSARPGRFLRAARKRVRCRG